MARAITASTASDAATKRYSRSTANTTAAAMTLARGVMMRRSIPRAMIATGEPDMSSPGRCSIGMLSTGPGDRMNNTRPATITITLSPSTAAGLVNVTYKGGAVKSVGATRPAAEIPCMAVE